MSKQDEQTIKRKRWHDCLTPDDLPGDLGLVARECGVDVAVALAENLGGMQLYVRNAERLIAARKVDYILKNFNGSNHKELAIETGWSERWVYEILKKGKSTAQPELFTSRS